MLPLSWEAATFKTPTSTKTRRNVDDDDDIDDSDDDDNDDNAPTITITVLFSSSFEPLPEPGFQRDALPLGKAVYP